MPLTHPAPHWTVERARTHGVEILGDMRFRERADELGGTWRDNTYPGCACDVASHLYSFSFAPKSDWSRFFSAQPEILDYLLDCASGRQTRSEALGYGGSEFVPWIIGATMSPSPPPDGASNRREIHR